MFLFEVLGRKLTCSGSVDGSAALVIRGRFQQKQIESVLRRYIRESIDSSYLAYYFRRIRHMPYM
jgi:translation initiation factor 2 subunit 2